MCNHCCIFPKTRKSIFSFICLFHIILVRNEIMNSSMFIKVFHDVYISLGAAFFNTCLAYYCDSYIYIYMSFHFLVSKSSSCVPAQHQNIDPYGKIWNASFLLRTKYQQAISSRLDSLFSLWRWNKIPSCCLFGRFMRIIPILWYGYQVHFIVFIW